MEAEKQQNWGLARGILRLTGVRENPVSGPGVRSLANGRNACERGEVSRAKDLKAAQGELKVQNEEWRR